jgi:uncharacterized NAD(P)/FAD-binding protein YdhS
VVTLLLVPKEYDDFITLMKKMVVYTILLRVVRHDEQAMEQSGLKLVRAYRAALEEAEQQIAKEIRRVKGEMKALGGMIIQEVQQPKLREVHVKFRGFTNVHQFLNEVLLAECEQSIRYFIHGNVKRESDPMSQ